MRNIYYVLTLFLAFALRGADTNYSRAVTFAFENVTDAFKEGGKPFLEHAMKYTNAVARLESMLVQKPPASRQELARSFNQLADVLAGTADLVAGMDFDTFQKRYEERTRPLVGQLDTDKIRKQESEAVRNELQQLEKKRPLTSREQARLIEVEAARRGADFRIGYTTNLLSRFKQLKEASDMRDEALMEMKDVHQSLANAYREVAAAYDAGAKYEAITAFLEEIEGKNLSLGEKIQRARHQITKALDQLESEMASIKEPLQ